MEPNSALFPGTLYLSSTNRDWNPVHECRVALWAYCLMPNHVYLIAVPELADGLSPAISEVHRRYSRRINFREEWRGHLRQGQLAAFPVDEPYLPAAGR